VESLQFGSRLTFQFEFVAVPASCIAVLKIMSNPDNDKLSAGTVSTSTPRARADSSGSPERPSYSPVTPTLSQASLASQDVPELPPAQWIDEPPPALPVSLDDNPDAIALRATLSILQIQRQQALRDMRDLDKMKTAALDSPDEFVQDLQAGKFSSKATQPDDEVPGDANNETSKFGKFPAPQNIVRTPPIEWSKYHIVGQSLDRMHQIQQQYPGSTEEMSASPSQLQPHIIAAPYRPFVDKLDERKSQSSSKS
jgi:hypothetical protein